MEKVWRGGCCAIFIHKIAFYASQEPEIVVE